MTEQSRFRSGKSGMIKDLCPGVSYFIGVAHVSFVTFWW
jgi:hypothetical protein